MAMPAINVATISKAMNRLWRIKSRYTSPRIDASAVCGQHRPRTMPSPLSTSTAIRPPLPGDPALARLGFERVAGGPAILQALAGTSEGRDLLGAIFGNSPFLSQLLHTEPDILEAFLTQDTAHVLADLERRRGV